MEKYGVRSHSQYAAKNIVNRTCYSPQTRSKSRFSSSFKTVLGNLLLWFLCIL